MFHDKRRSTESFCPMYRHHHFRTIDMRIMDYDRFSNYVRTWNRKKTMRGSKSYRGWRSYRPQSPFGREKIFAPFFNGFSLFWQNKWSPQQMCLRACVTVDGYIWNSCEEGWESLKRSQKVKFSQILTTGERAPLSAFSNFITQLPPFERLLGQGFCAKRFRPKT